MNDSNITTLYDNDDKVGTAFIEATHLLEKLKEEMGLTESQQVAVVTLLTRWSTDYLYYSVNGLWDEDEE
jgi:hypothetical protein